MKKIEIVFMDVDGTLTDGKVYIGQSGEIFKVFSVKDGLGIHDLLLKQNIKPVVITGRESQIVMNRCKELGINEIYQGISDKVGLIKDICDRYKVTLKESAYIGDDLNDLECLKEINKNRGITGCPSDATEQVRNICTFVSKYPGGQGAVREFCEYILAL